MADRFSFARVQLNPGVTAATSPNAITSAETGGTSALANRALVAIAGNGDQSLEGGETGYILAAMARGNRVTEADVLNGWNDPVGISVQGRIVANTVGALGLDASLGHGTRGFGVKYGTETGSMGLNRGDSITRTLNEDGGMAQRVQKVAFTVDRNGSTAAAEVAIAFDGNVVRSGSYAAAQTTADADAALRLGVNGGDAIAIDFEASLLTVNGTARTGAEIDSFFAQCAAHPERQVKIGVTDGPNSSSQDLSLEWADFDVVTETPASGVSMPPNGTSLSENFDRSVPNEAPNTAIGYGQSTVRHDEKLEKENDKMTDEDNMKAVLDSNLNYQKLEKYSKLFQNFITTPAVNISSNGVGIAEVENIYPGNAIVEFEGEDDFALSNEVADLTSMHDLRGDRLSENDVRGDFGQSATNAVAANVADEPSLAHTALSEVSFSEDKSALSRTNGSDQDNSPLSLADFIGDTGAALLPRPSRCLPP